MAIVSALAFKCLQVQGVYTVGFKRSEESPKKAFANADALFFSVLWQYAGVDFSA